MTDRELMQQALEALKRYRTETPLGHQPHMIAEDADKAITALRERLAQPEQEPVAWISEGGDVSRSKRYMDEMGFKCNPLYTAPRQWQGLTEEETDELVRRFSRYELLRAIEAKLKEKNNG